MKNNMRMVTPYDNGIKYVYFYMDGKWIKFKRHPAYVCDWHTVINYYQKRKISVAIEISTLQRIRRGLHRVAEHSFNFMKGIK
jgi:hypothetical protein